MAHVWHQIFVHSANGGAFEAYANAEFQQRLRDGALGSFENLLLKYALAPQLGQYQNWAKNVPEHDGIRPNENFARELLQLFTIGVNLLNEDGTPKLDAKGQLVAAYAQSDIETLARVLTGYTFPTRPGADARLLGEPELLRRRHDPVRPVARQGREVRARRPHQLRARAAARRPRYAPPSRRWSIIPNTPPFIAKQMIQKTVTSSPTSRYVARVASAFKDNGKGGAAISRR